MKAGVKWVVGGLAAAAICLQFTNPARTNPPVTPGHDLLATNPPPAEIVALLHGACYDCHSDETKWPWYSHVAPVSWFLVDHVNEGRRHLNFSNWPHDDPASARKKWNHVADQVSSGDMPLSSYAWIHASARLTAGQREQLVKWAEEEAKRLKSDAD